MASSPPPLPLRVLYRLQQVDTSLAQTEERLRTLDAGAALEARLQEGEAAAAGAQQDLAARQSRLRDLDLELQSTLAKRKHFEDEMYSGRVRNPKELASLQDEVSSLDRHRGQLEDAILTLMEETEILQASAATLATVASQARDEYALHEAEYAALHATLTGSLETLQAERERVAAVVDEDLLHRYNRIRERMGPVAVAAVRNGVCEGCHVAIPEGRVRRLQEEEDLLLTCERCGRILVLPDE